MNRLPAPLLVITDRHQASLPIDEIAEAVGRGGGRWLMLRDKDLAAAERACLAAKVAAIAGRHGMHLSISADAGLAAELGASIHVQDAAEVRAARQRCGARAVIGVSAHGQEEAAAAAAAGCDYVTLSPIFPTISKPGYGPALGVAAIARAAKLGVPVIALGGIAADAIGPCFGAGASGIAVMGEVMRSSDPCRTVANLVALCNTET